MIQFHWVVFLIPLNMNYWCLSFIIFLFACNLNSDASTVSITQLDENPPTRRALFRKQYELKDIHLITPAGIEAYQELWNSMEGEIGRGMIPKFSTDDDWDEKELASKVLFLVGSNSEHKIIQMFQEIIPFEFKDQQLKFADKTFEDPNSIIRISLYPNPLNPAIPVYLLTGNTDKEIIQFITGQYQKDWRRFIRSSFGYQVYEKGKCQMSGFFSERTWKVDKAIHWDFSYDEENNYKTNHFEFADHRITRSKSKAKNDLVNIGNACEANCKLIAEFFGRPINRSIAYHVYENMERKGLMTYNTEQSHMVLGKNEIHVTHSSAYLDNHLQLENRYFLSEILGKAASPWLANGTSIFFAKKWQRYGFKHWAKKLLISDNLPPLTALLDSKLIGFESPIVLGAGQAAMVDYLLTTWGKEKFIEQYNNWNPTAEELEKLANRFESHVSNYQMKQIPAKPKRKRYLQGFNFAHEGYQIYNGYGSSLSQKSLQQMHQLGSNALALVPYSYMRDPKAPSTIPIVNAAGSETDESLIHSIEHAKELGMTTVMKPQLWLGSSWTGFVEMKTQKDWDTFFENYYRWIKHFALLSEIYEVDVFSVGVEFVQATLQNEAAWVKMFEKIRPLFSGEITYCANWGDEFEKLSFWASLDFIGLNCYYPLSDKDQPSQKELDQNFAKTTDKIEKIANKFDKKIIFTEIGFRSVEGTWKNPHAQAEGRAYDEKAQAKAYEAVFKNIENKNWCEGILWWKWPSYLEYSTPENTRFTPSEKAAEEVVRKWFNRH